MGVAIIGMGLPGAGKTTELKRLAEELNAVYICGDDIQEQVFRHPSVQRDTKRIWGIVHRRARKALMAGKNVVIDGTHIKRRYRISTIQACNSAESITLIWFQAPVKECIRRNKHNISEGSIRKMSQILLKESPKSSEGYDRLELITTSAPIY